jgi:hypothetical protein
MSIEKSDIKALIRGKGRLREPEKPRIILAILAFCWMNDLSEDDFFIIEPKTGAERERS